MFRTSVHKLLKHTVYFERVQKGTQFGATVFTVCVDTFQSQTCHPVSKCLEHAGIDNYHRFFEMPVKLWLSVLQANVCFLMILFGAPTKEPLP